MPEVEKLPNDISVDEPTTFNPNAYEWPKHLKKALDELSEKKLSIDVYWQYYDGKHPKLWITDELTDTYRNKELLLQNAENWIDFAVDAPIKRMEIEGWQTVEENNPRKDPTLNPEDPDDSPSKVINQTAITAVKNVFSDNDMQLEQKDLYRGMRIAGESYVFAWKDDEKKSGFDLAVNDARNVYWPKNADRTNPHHVIKVWIDDEEEIWRATVYYKFVCIRLRGPSSRNHEDFPTDVRSFEPDPRDSGGVHGFDRPPVIRFSMNKHRRSLVATLIPTQNRINKLEANKMVAAEWTAHRRLAIMTKQQIDDDTARLRPNRATVLDPGGDGDTAPTSIWEGSAAELSNFDDSIRTEIDKLFTKATLPSHIAVEAGKVAPSGVEREADEGPFVEMIKDTEAVLDACWVDLWQLLFGEIEVKPVWRNPSIKSDSEQVATASAAVTGGLPADMAWQKYAGLDDDELRAIKAEQARKEARQDEMFNRQESLKERQQQQKEQQNKSKVGGPSGAQRT